jgi:hypothetical protein
MHRCILGDDGDLFNETDEVNYRAIWLLPSGSPTWQPTLATRSFLGFADSPSEQILD